MKIAFSTLTCPSWGFNEIFSTAKDFGFDGIEIRGIANEMYAPNIAVFEKSEIEKTKKRLFDAGLRISCLTSGACLADKNKVDEGVVEAKEYIDLAEKLGVKYVRVMPTGVPYKDGGDFGIALKGYTELCEYGVQKGVTPIMETNGMFADTTLLRSFMESCPSENKGVLWDMNHPYRFNGESINETVVNIGKYIKYVHVKDSREENGTLSYKLCGYGDAPIKEVVSELKKLGYDGFLSLEWTKRWQKNLEEPYIVIPIFAGYIKAILS